MGPEHLNPVVGGIFEASAAHPCEKHLKSDSGFKPSQRSSGAHVRTTTKRKMATRLGPIKTKRIRIVELVHIAIR
jgi:hypothetical protein